MHFLTGDYPRVMAADRALRGLSRNAPDVFHEELALYRVQRVRHNWRQSTTNPEALQAALQVLHQA